MNFSQVKKKKFSFNVIDRDLSFENWQPVATTYTEAKFISSKSIIYPPIFFETKDTYFEIARKYFGGTKHNKRGVKSLCNHLASTWVA